MTRKEIKLQIEKALDNVPDNVLLDILDFLKNLQNQPAGSLDLATHLRKILSEDIELLEKLAK